MKKQPVYDAEFFRKMGAQGGRKRSKNATKEQMSKWGKKGARSRWAKKRRDAK